VGWPAIRSGIAPDIPVALRRLSRAPRFLKPGVPVGAVVRHIVEDDLDAAAMGGGHERVEIRQAAEDRIDGGEVRDVIAEIGHGRGIYGREPEGVDAEPGEIIEPPEDAREIADPVAIAVLKGARIDLIDDRALPPSMGRWGMD